MQYIGLDLGKVNSQICVITEDGEIFEKRLKTERETLAQFFGQRLEKCRILLEASTESEWVARHLEGLGHEVIVADPNFAPMYARRSKKIKTDKRDARALCEACRLGTYRSSHRTSDEQRRVRGQLAVRESLVRTRTKYISLIRSLLRREGWRVSSGAARCFANRVKDLVLPTSLLEEIEPLLVLLETLNEQIAKADEKLEKIVEHDEGVKRLTSVPGVGKVTATAFVAALDNVERFDDAKQVRSYLGLVPTESSSGEKQYRGRISKTGNKRVRTLLVEAAWSILSHQNLKAAESLRKWANNIAQRRGKHIVAVALARKLAGILYALWRDKTDFHIEQTLFAPAITKGQ
jgi:transposase